MWKFFNIGVVFFKNSTDLLLTQIIFYAIIPTIEECGRNIFILSVFALNGSCRNRAVQIPDFAYRNRQNQQGRKGRLTATERYPRSFRARRTGAGRNKFVLFPETERHAAT